MRTLGRLVLAVLVLGVLLGVTFYLRPLWVLQQGTHFGLFLSRVQSNYVLTPEGRRFDRPTVGTVERAVERALHATRARDVDTIRTFLQRLVRALERDADAVRLAR